MSIIGNASKVLEPNCSQPQHVPRIDPDDSLTDHSTEALDSDDDCGDEPEQRNLSVVSFCWLIGF